MPDCQCTTRTRRFAALPLEIEPTPRHISHTALEVMALDTPHRSPVPTREPPPTARMMRARGMERAAARGHSLTHSLTLICCCRPDQAASADALLPCARPSIMLLWRNSQQGQSSNTFPGTPRLPRPSSDTSDGWLDTACDDLSPNHGSGQHTAIGQHG